MQPPMGYPTYPNPGYSAYSNPAAHGHGGVPRIPPHLAADYSAGFGTAVGRTLSRAVRFRGMASRREFWWSYLASWLVGVLTAVIVGFVIGGYAFLGIPLRVDVLTVSALVILAVIHIICGLCMMSAAVRRLHDGGRSGAWILIAFVPVAGGIILLVLLAQETRPWLWRPEWVTG